MFQLLNLLSSSNQKRNGENKQGLLQDLSRKEKRWVQDQRCSKKKIRMRKKEVFRPKEARWIQEKRGSTDKKISAEEEVGKTICFWLPKRNRRRTTIHFITIFFEVYPKSKYKKRRKAAPTLLFILNLQIFYLFKRSKAFASADITNLVLRILHSLKRPYRYLQIV